MVPVMTDSKLLARDIEEGKLWLSCKSSMSINSICGDQESIDLIIAALRAYEPPHICKWIWSLYSPGSYASRYKGTCDCGCVIFTRDLVPVEETT